jgi:CheY-like chemotaxis protein
VAVGRLVEPEAEVLVIDDDPNARELLTAELRRLGQLQVTAVDSGRAGLAAISSRRPDIIILDLMIPEVDGFAVLQALGSNPKTSDIPVVVLSAKELTVAERAYLQRRVGALMVKGKATPEQLRAHLSLMLAQTGAQGAGPPSIISI